MTSDTFPYTFPFFFYDTVEKRVRPFLMVNLTSDETTLPQVKHGAWQPTGSAYKCVLSGNYFYFYIDGVLKEQWDISNIVLDQNIKFSKGYPHNYNVFRFQLIDTAYSSQGVVDDFASISGNITGYKVKDLSTGLQISNDSGQTWTSVPGKKLDVVLGWNYDTITGRYSDEDSINQYGPHFYRVSEPLITTNDDALTVAKRYVETYKDGLKTGTITIDGKTGIDLTSKFKLYLPEVGINETLNIVSYTQRIDKNGFTTTINYGTEPFDIAAKVARLEREVYG